jgi:hypothetical protein
VQLVSNPGRCLTCLSLLVFIHGNRKALAKDDERAGVSTRLE